ncbi:MAG: RNA polymerase sigma factor [Bacteroidota bacterium]
MEQEFLARIDQHQGIIHKVCRMYVRLEEDREDLFQEIVLQLWRSYARFDQTLTFSTWMYRVALNTAITQLRRSKRRPVFQSLSKKDEHIPETNASHEDELYEAISHLDKIDKAILLLQLDNHSYQEIAEIMQVSSSNVGVRLNRIKKKLKSILIKQTHEPR